MGDPENLTELMLFYVERGISHLLEWEDADEAFYQSIIRVFTDGLELLGQCETEAVGKFLPRYKGAVQATENMNWGFYEALRDTFYCYAPEV